ncbi:MAG: shikimate kinase [Gemmatimonadales bacterium]|nr:MAG: shikimate kinase [Gemmatimonadales bacterium]
MARVPDGAFLGRAPHPVTPPTTPPPEAPRRILLVGFMAAGKSAVGRALARDLFWRFLDMDREIARRAGRSIQAIFRDDGEDAFREMESRIGDELLARDGVVVASGGGWPCRPGRLDRVPPGTLSIWLQVRVEVIVERAMRRKGARPLLDVPDPEARVRELLAEREPWYEKADWTVSGDHGSPAQVARRIGARLRESYTRG